VAEGLAPRACSEDGFTLVEVLVALVILAVATAGLIQAAEGHIDSIEGMQSRAVAQWVAENRIVELTLAPESREQLPETVEMGGQSWTVRLSERPVEDPSLSALTVSVARLDQVEPLVAMDFFLPAAEAAP
jgi:general secretion pathway protein I